MKKLVITFIIVTVSAFSLYSQNRTVYGRVISEQFDIMIGITITISDSIKVGSTDLKGFFKIEIPDSVKTILLSAVGLEPTTLQFEDNCNDVEVVMMFSVTYDFITLRKVDRLRMKRFKKLPELHKEAFAKGLFKTAKACYTQEFIPYYKKRKRK